MHNFCIMANVMGISKVTQMREIALQVLLGISGLFESETSHLKYTET